MKKFFFPFSGEKYKFLEKKRWHRLMKVMFFMGIPFLWILFLQIGWEVEKEGDKILLGSIVGTILSYYILQLIYFKIIIYIAYGKEE